MIFPLNSFFYVIDILMVIIGQKIASCSWRICLLGQTQLSKDYIDYRIFFPLRLILISGRQDNGSKFLVMHVFVNSGLGTEVGYVTKRRY